MTGTGRCLALSLALAAAAAGCGERDGSASRIELEEPRPRASEDQPAETTAAPASDQLPAEETWRPLLAGGRFAEAKTFCEGLRDGADDRLAASGHACLANLALATCGTKRPTPDCAAAALAALGAALDRAPSERRLHLGRLRVLMDAGREDELAGSLNESLARRPGTPADLDKWLGYSFELIERQRLREAAAYTEVLRARFPDQPQVLSTLGACLTDLQQYDRAEAVLNHALSVRPGAASVNWGLAWLHERTGRFDSARRYFEAALARAPTAETLAAWGCTYASLLERNGLREEACRRQREHCPPGAVTACAP